MAQIPKGRLVKGLYKPICRDGLPYTFQLLCIYLHDWLIFMVNAGKYTIHGCYGLNVFYIFLKTIKHGSGTWTNAFD